MKRTEADKKYKWDFKSIYKDIVAWKKDLELLKSKIAEIKSFEGKLSEEKYFISYLEKDEEIDYISTKLSHYLHLIDLDQTDEQLLILDGLFSNVMQEYEEISYFVEPELKKIGEKQIILYLQKNIKWQKEIFGFKIFFKKAKHILNDHDEQLLSKVSESRTHIWSMYDVLAYADKSDEFIIYKDKQCLLTSSLLSEILEDSDPIKDQQLRITASNKYSKNFIERKHSFANIYEGIIKNEVEENKIRNYKSCLSSALSSDDINENVYLKLLKIGKKNIWVFKKYLNILKNNLNLKHFYPSDRMLKLVKKYNKKFTISEAKEIIKESVLILGDEYLVNLDKAWSDNKIDYFEDTNKLEGAYSTGGWCVEPVILMNWDYTLSSVNTLAHEIGHSVHTIFSDKNQEYPLSEYPIILAEIASTMNEHLLFESLYNKCNNKEEKIYLLQNRIFELVSTFYRQIQFADFELQAHKMVEKKEPLTAEKLAKLFSKIQMEYGYDTFDVQKELPYSWSRISHFFHSPFYVYKYAIDIVASFYFYCKIKNKDYDSSFYLNFLKCGGKKYPLDILKDYGLDFEQEETYKPFINYLNELCNELQNLL